MGNAGRVELKTIPIEADALEKLATAKCHPDESWSDVIRRAHFRAKPPTTGDLLDFMTKPGCIDALPSEEALDCLEATLNDPGRRSASHWNDADAV